MLKVLLKKQMTEIFRSYFYDAKKNRARSRLATALYIVLFAVLIVGVLGGMFGYLSYALCAPLTAVGMDWLYFAVMGLLAVLFGAFGSVFNTYAGLYLAKDNDLLLSMPIPVRTVMTARLLGVYLMGLMYSGIVALSAVVVYAFTAPVTAGAAVGALVYVVMISIFVLTLSCALGWVVAKISLRLKRKSFITVIISVVLFALYYFVYFRAQTVISDLIANASVYGGKIKGAAYPVYLFGRMATGDVIALLSVSVVVLLLFALMCFLISRSFLKIATSTGASEKKKGKAQIGERRSTRAALLSKEFSRFFNNANYMLNCGMGTLFLPAAGIALLVKGRDIVSVLDEAFGQGSGAVPLLLSAVICFVVCMNDITAPSVSLEAKTLWLSQSLPVTPRQVICAKLAVQLILTGVPVIFCLCCAVVVFPFTVAEFLLTAAVSLSFVLLSALFGMFLGLRMPNLNWTNEITPIKQSACVAVTLIGGMFYVAVLAVVYPVTGWHIGATAYMGCVALLSLILSGGLWLWIRGRGSRIFASL